MLETETSMLVFVPGLLSRNPGDQSYPLTATCSLPVQVLHPSVERFQIFPPGILPVTLSPGSCCSFFVPLMTWSLIWFLGACEFLPLQCFTLEQQRCYNISIPVCLVMCVNPEITLKFSKLYSCHITTNFKESLAKLALKSSFYWVYINIVTWEHNFQGASC